MWGGITTHSYTGLKAPVRPSHGEHGAPGAIALDVLETSPRVRVVDLLAGDGVDEDARDVGVLPVAVLVGRDLPRLELLVPPAPVAQGLREVIGWRRSHWRRGRTGRERSHSS